MNYVLDASVAFKWLIPEVDSDKANRLRDELRNSSCELDAPDFFPIELAHSLTRAERQARIAVGQAQILWADAMTTPPKLLSSVAVAVRAIDMSSKLRIGVYDCIYAAIAEQESCSFLTADDKLIRNLGPILSFMIPPSCPN